MNKKAKIKELLKRLNSFDNSKQTGDIGKEMGDLTSGLVEQEMSSIKESITSKLGETSAFKALRKVEIILAKMKEELNPKVIIETISAFEDEMTKEKDAMSTYFQKKLDDLNTSVEEMKSGMDDLTLNNSSLAGSLDFNKQEFISKIDERYNLAKNDIGKLNASVDDIYTLISQTTKSVSDNIKTVTMNDENSVKTLSDRLEKLRTDFINKLASIESSINKTGMNHLGGGSPHRKIMIDSVEVATRYTDINFITSGLTIVASNNDALKVTNLTTTATPAVITYTGTVNGSNNTFVFNIAPSIIYVDGLTKQKTSSDGSVNWTGTTTVVLAIAPNFDLFGV